MKSEYKDTSSFLDDLHEEVSLREMLMDMGIVEKKQFHGQFIQCVFHDGDNTPSLQITDNFYKCYACGEKGDIVSFIERYYNEDFMGAIRHIAKFLNVNISNIQYKFDGKIQKLHQEWEGYLQNMKDASQDVKELQRDYFPQEIGYDSRMKYVVLPITSKTGTILGFTKRRIDFLHDMSEGAKQPAKWIHSSLKDSLIGQCHNIFNLSIATPEMKKKGQVVLTEGPKDAIAYRRIGINHVICSCGTANSQNIWEGILPIRSVVLSMDGDEAGKLANIKTILYLNTLMDIQNIEVVTLPEEEDPYSVKDLKIHWNTKIPALNYMAQEAELKDLQDLYEKTLEFNRSQIIKALCKTKMYSVSEAESWLFQNEKRKTETSTMDERELLLSYLRDPEVNIPYMTPEKAKSILKMKYGEVV